MVSDTEVGNISFLFLIFLLYFSLKTTSNKTDSKERMIRFVMVSSWSERERKRKIASKLLLLLFVHLKWERVYKNPFESIHIDFCLLLYGADFDSLGKTQNIRKIWSQLENHQTGTMKTNWQRQMQRVISHCEERMISPLHYVILTTSSIHAMAIYIRSLEMLYVIRISETQTVYTQTHMKLNCMFEIVSGLSFNFHTYIRHISHSSGY